LIFKKNMTIRQELILIGIITIEGAVIKDGEFSLMAAFN